MQVATNLDKAEKLSRWRAQFMPFMAVLLLAQQSLFMSWDWRAVTLVQTVGWCVLALVLLLVLVTGGAWFATRSVRELANDELTQFNRSKAIERGFVAALLTAILVFAVSPIEPITAQRAAHLIVSIGIAVALLVFGLEERKAFD